MGNLEIVLASDEQRWKIAAEVFFDGKFVALISQEDGPEKLKIEFPGTGLHEDLLTRVVDFQEFSEALEMARKRLLGMPG